MPLTGSYARQNVGALVERFQMNDGTLLCYDMASQDGGRTWQRYQPFNFPLVDGTRPCRGPNVTLEDGTILLLGRPTRKHEREEGVYVVEIYRSRDNFASYAGPNRGLVYATQATHNHRTYSSRYSVTVPSGAGREIVQNFDLTD